MLKSALKKSSRYQGDTEDEGEVGGNNDLLAPPSSSSGLRHRRNLSWGSGLTAGSASSTGTEYFSAVSDDEEDFLTPPDMEAEPVGEMVHPDDIGIDLPDGGPWRLANKGADDLPVMLLRFGRDGDLYSERSQPANHSSRSADRRFPDPVGIISRSKREELLAEQVTPEIVVAINVKCV